jgi:hypothetical protein
MVQDNEGAAERGGAVYRRYVGPPAHTGPAVVPICRPGATVRGATDHLSVRRLSLPTPSMAFDQQTFPDS